MRFVVPSEIVSCGVVAHADLSVTWRVWAPNARDVELVLFDGERQRRLPMNPEVRGCFRHTEADIAEGWRYAFRIDGGPSRPDPRSLWQPDGVHHPSAVLFPERFVWTDHDWRGVARADLVFYELHVGTFTAEGTFDAVIPRLAELRDLGVTAIELMPVAQFPGTRNWGYDGVQLFAPQNSYGGPHGLQRLVDACHAHGLAIFLDVVFNHFGPEGNYVHEFGPYGSKRYRTPWGPAFNFDGPGSDFVRAFVLDNMRLWLDAYHFDGLRLDATHAMFDIRPKHILREARETADEIQRRTGRLLHLVPESLQNDVRVIQAPELGGHGLDAEWNEDPHHVLHAYLTGERHGKYVDFGRMSDFVKLFERTFALDGQYSEYRGRVWGGPDAGLPGDRFIVGSQNHDHIGNRARGDRLTTQLTPAQLRLAAAFTLLSPHLPFLFMGEEYGEENPFAFFCSFQDAQLIDNVRVGRQRDYELEGIIPDPQDEETFLRCRLSWAWPERTHHAGLRHLYRDLLTARREWPALRDFRNRTARLLPDADEGPILELVRGAKDAEALWIYFNLSASSQPFPGRADAVPLLSTEAARYQGSRIHEGGIREMAPYECLVTATKNPRARRGS